MVPDKICPELGLVGMPEPPGNVSSAGLKTSCQEAEEETLFLAFRVCSRRCGGTTMNTATATQPKKGDASAVNVQVILRCRWVALPAEC